MNSKRLQIQLIAVCLAGLFWLVASTMWAEQEAEQVSVSTFTAEQLKFFEAEVRPLLVSECYKCHSSRKQEGGLRLDARSLILEGGESGPAIEPGKPEESLLVEAIKHEGFEMPPKKMLRPEQIAILEKWVKMQAPWPADEKIEAVVDEWAEKVEKGKHHWAFQPLKPVPIPQTQNRNWGHNPVDSFVLHQLEENNMEPAAPATKQQLIRRLYYDLTGLPPTKAAVSEFVNDETPDAYEQLVERLLASPNYGEKWGRHWLDLVHYAETNSYERDGAKPFVWRYRDYVINAFNNDMPYDQFIKEQLAGDEMQTDDPRAIIATGYYRLGIWDDEPADPELAFYDDLDDLVSTTSEVFMGLTFGCARCHDHKLDPISQKDYYSLVSFMRNVRRYGVRSAASVKENSVTSITTLEERERLQQSKASRKELMKLGIIDRQLKNIEEPVVEVLDGVDEEEYKFESRRTDILKKYVPKLISADNLKKYTALLAEKNKLKNMPLAGFEQALSVTENGPNPLTTFVLVRGNPHAPGEKVEPTRPSALAEFTPELTPPVARVNSTGRRSSLANWIASSEHPLTARVLVNRVWQYHFGRGIVRSSSNFGLAGEAPTHPELLDWLTNDFIKHGWSVKELHRQILLSETFRMSSTSRKDYETQDPLNNNFWRFNMRRLTAEEVRDSILEMSGNLTQTKLYGPSVYSEIPDEVKAGQSKPGKGWGKSTPFERYRRSIYIHSKRSLVTPILSSFDVADLDDSCPIRFVTTQPTQALGMLNSDFMIEQAADFSHTVRKQAGDKSEKQLVTLCLEKVLQRDPEQKEVERALQFLSKMKQERGMNDSQAFQSFCLLILNLNEFIYLD